MIMNRAWSMPSMNTFTVKPMQALIKKYMELRLDGDVADPFVRNSVFKSLCNKTNDLDPAIEADFHLEASEFVSQLENNSVSLMLIDPPYSPRQIKDCYSGIGKQFFKEDAQSSFYASVKNAAKDKVMPGGFVIYFGWNSNGMGKSRGFELVEVLLVAHGAAINDTIVTVERKV